MKLIYGLILFVMIVFVPSCTNIYESHDIDVSNDSVLYKEEFKTSMGDFITLSKDTNQQWEYSAQFKCMVISGFVNPKSFDNKDWLISPEIDLTKATAARVVFDHAGSYFNDVNEVSVWVTDSYVDTAFAESIWTRLEIPNQILNSNDFTFVNNQISLTNYAGKKVRVAFRYVSTAAKAGTWEVKNFRVENKEAVIVKKFIGEGSDTIPYSVAGAIANQAGAGYVKGYIVGYLWSGLSTSYIMGSDTCTQATNILLADTTNTYFSKCIPVQLPVGAVRTALNLKDNKANYGRKVTIYGTLESYFGVEGLKNASYYVKENGETGGTKPVKAIFTESFASASQGAFTIQHVILPSGLASVWTTTASYGMKATGYSGGNKASESWLISPAFSLAKVSKATLTFDHALNYLGSAKAFNFVTVWVSLDYQSGAPSTGNWSQVTIPTYPVGSNWTFVNSGDVSLNDFTGEPNVRIAFKYTSTTSTCTTWEVKNVIVK